MYYNIPVSGLGSLLNISSSFKNSPLTLWVRTFDFQKQLYIDSGFSSYVGIDYDVFYEDSNVFDSLVIPEHLASIHKDIENQISHPHQLQIDTCRFDLRTKAGIQTHQTIRFPILNQHQRVIALAGLDYALTYNLSASSKSNEAILFAERMQLFDNQLKDILLKEEKRLSLIDDAKLQLPDNRQKYTINGQVFSLTRREIQCLNETIKGASAKEIGEKVFLARRTVEEYLDNIREKAKCKNKLELIAKFSSYLKNNPQSA
jgi:DNA-binding CsgD family transcriptional regulator